MEDAKKQEIIVVDPFDVKLPGNTRTDAEASVDDGFCDSLEQEQFQPIIIDSDFNVIEGNRRVLAGRKRKIKLKAIVRADVLNETDRTLFQLEADAHHAGFSDSDKALACQKLLREGMKQKDIAVRLKISEANVSRMVAALKTIPAIQKAQSDGLVGSGQVVAMSKAPLDRQGDLLAAALAGETRDGLESMVKRMKAAAKPSVRVGRLSCALPDSVNVTITANEIDLDMAIEKLAELLKEAKRARDLGYDPKTFAATLRDKNK